jgi:hypothetical protein
MMNLQQEKEKFVEKLGQLHLAISEIESDFTFQILKNTDLNSATGRKLTQEVFKPLETWRGFSDVLNRVFAQCEEYESKSATADALNALTGQRAKLGNKSAADVLDEVLTKVARQKADMLDTLSEICDACTTITTVFQGLRQPLETAMNQYKYALSVVPDATALITTLKQSETILLADPTGFKSDSSGITTLRDRVRGVVADLEQNGKKLADVPMLKSTFKELLIKLPQELSNAQKIVRAAEVISTALPTVDEYTALIVQGKKIITALESGKISDINEALQWQGAVHKMLTDIASVLAGIEARKIKLEQIRSNLRIARSTITEYGLETEPVLNKLVEEARGVLGSRPVDVVRFEEIVEQLFSEIRDLRIKFS